MAQVFAVQLCTTNCRHASEVTRTRWRGQFVVPAIIDRAVA
jgi:hypothetical protein